jgi:hypothetical protein
MSQPAAFYADAGVECQGPAAPAPEEPEMKKLRALPAALFALSSLLLAAPAICAEQLPDADTREVQAYVLTEPALAKYMQATRGLKGIKLGECDDEEDADSISEAAAKIDAVPAAKSAVQGAGMTSREYVVFAFSLVQNGAAAYLLQTPGGKLPAGVSMANVDFYRKHSAELEQLAQETEDESCEDDDDD